MGRGIGTAAVLLVLGVAAGALGGSMRTHDKLSAEYVSEVASLEGSIRELEADNAGLMRWIEVADRVIADQRGEVARLTDDYQAKVTEAELAVAEWEEAEAALADAQSRGLTTVFLERAVDDRFRIAWEARSRECVACAALQASNSVLAVDLDTGLEARDDAIANLDALGNAQSSRADLAVGELERQTRRSFLERFHLEPNGWTVATIILTLEKLIG